MSKTIVDTKTFKEKKMNNITNSADRGKTVMAKIIEMAGLKDKLPDPETADIKEIFKTMQEDK